MGKFNHKNNDKVNTTKEVHNATILVFFITVFSSPSIKLIKKAPNSHGFVNPRDIEQMWKDQFDWVYREYDYAVFTMTIHPDVSGRPQVLMMHERLYDHISNHPGVRFCKFEEIAKDFKRRSPRKSTKRKR